MVATFKPTYSFFFWISAMEPLLTRTGHPLYNGHSPWSQPHHHSEQYLTNPCFVATTLQQPWIPLYYATYYVPNDSRKITNQRCRVDIAMSLMTYCMITATGWTLYYIIVSVNVCMECYAWFKSSMGGVKASEKAQGDADCFTCNCQTRDHSSSAVKSVLYTTECTLYLSYFDTFWLAPPSES